MASSRQNSSQMLNSQSSSSNSTNSTGGKDKTVHSKADTKNKHGKVIHKFTSESYLRIICEKSSPSTTSSNKDKTLLLVDKSSSSTSGHVPMSSNTIINSMNNMSKRKGTSFQITSVSVSSGNNNNNSTQQQQQMQQRTSADNNNGDDSADDLDESHTDDNISRITDYETPSFSEDTFSREDVYFAQPNAFGTAPVIPTSSQYGLAIVGPDMGGNGGNMADVHVSVSDAGINIMGQIPSKQDVDHKNERFKVVKIESTEPFKRGRWMCMDYLDHTTLQAQDDGIDGSSKEDGDDNYVRTKDNDLEGGDNVQDNGDMEHINDNDAYDQEVYRVEMMNHHDQASHEHHTMTSIPIHNELHSMTPLGHLSQAQSMPQGQIQQLILPADNNNLSTATIKETTVENPSSITLPNQASHSGGGNQQNPSVDNSPVIQYHAQTMTPDMIHRSLENPNSTHQHHHPTQSHQQQQLNQGATLPANILQNLGLDQQSQTNRNASNNASASPIPSNSNSEYVGESESKQHQDSSTTSQFHHQQFGTGDNKQGSNEADFNHQQQQHQQQQLSTNDNIISSSVSDNNNMNNNDGTQSNPPTSSSAGLGTVPEGIAVNSASEVSSSNAGNASAGDDGQSVNEDSER